MWNLSKNPFIKNYRPLVMAHRGESANIPENTLQAFEDAFNSGVDCIETDIHLTKDNHFVFFHDEKLNRTTNGNGKISKYTLKELKQLDAGYNFIQIENGKITYPYRGKGYRIYAIEEIIPIFPKIRFNIDIKDRNSVAPKLLAKQLREMGVEERVMVGSFHQKQINSFRKVAPEISTSAGPKEVLQFWIKSKNAKSSINSINAGYDKTEVHNRTYETTDIVEEWEHCQIKFFGKKLPYIALQIPESYSIFQIINPEFIEFAHTVGIAVHVWTINDENTMRKLLDWNVDGIFTDHPKKLLNLINTYSF
ncbi:MAG: glycerophosphodiester phosphodiesterase [Candidatus Lokiarchaeota archaeon]|nr:glycerophosphodiester phosphodiesterase [Candidatus Harpocratesius repetitus]